MRIQAAPSNDGRTAGLFLAAATVLTAVVASAPLIWPRGDAPPRPHVVADRFLGNWLWWDGAWYVQIATSGYSYKPHHQSAVAFFPVYPLVVRAMGAVTPGGVPLAAILVTLSSGLGAFILFRRWCQRRLESRATTLAVVVLAVYPYAWFLYGAAYSDALFLLLVIGAFLLVEDDHPWAAGALGAIATATRPTGIALPIGLVAVLWQRRRGRLRRRDAGVLLAPVGLLAWSTWLGIRFHNPLAFIETEGAPGWDQAPGWRTWLKNTFFHHLLHDPVRAWLPLLVQAVLCAAFLAAVPAVTHRFGVGYGVYVLVAVAIPMVGTADFMGVGRYLLAAFPVFALLADTIHRRDVTRVAVLACSAAGLVVGASLFGSGYLLS
jgi:Gpi18-like mannosyltransferase